MAIITRPCQINQDVSFLKYIFMFALAALGIELKALCMSDRHSTTKLYPQAPHVFFKYPLIIC